MKKVCALILALMMLASVCITPVLGAVCNHTYSNACDRDCNLCGEVRKAPHIYSGACDPYCDLCGIVQAVVDHTYDNACDPNCNVCGATRTTDLHVYDYSCDPDCNECGAVREVHAYDNACDEDCNLCGEMREVEGHTYKNACDVDCNICGVIREVPDHKYDNPCDATCNECKAERTVGDHVYSDNCDIDCNLCGAIRTPIHEYTDRTDLYCDVCGATRYVASNQIVSASEFTTGQYIMMIDTGYAPGVYSEGWVTAVQPPMVEDTIVADNGGVWSLIVSGTSVTIVDMNGVSIAPKGGNNNGIKNGNYQWEWRFDNGKFTFHGVGEDTVVLASNKGSQNKFRAYKNATASNTGSFPSQFTLYRLDEGNGEEPDDPEEPNEPDEPEEPVQPSTSATISFTDKANRVSYSTEQQVWQQNGITVTNDKGTSSNNVGDYGGDGYPVRFYKGTAVTIEYPGITSIVIDCQELEEKYVNGWVDSTIGAAAIIEDGFVTIVLSTATNSFTWEKLTAQCRAYSITVYGGGDVPENPEEPEPDVPEEPEEPDEPSEPDTPVGPDEPSEPDEPDVPGGNYDTEMDTSIPYVLGMVQENVSTEDVYMLNGEMDKYYMATTIDDTQAILVYLVETEGGYYLKTEDGRYINMVVAEGSDGRTHINGAYESIPSTVYNYDLDLYTLVTDIDGALYAFGTRNDKQYTTVGPVKVSYNGFHVDLYYFEDEPGDEPVEPCTHEYDDEYDADCNLCGERREVPEKPTEHVGTIEVSSAQAEVGGTVQVTVSVKNNPGIISAKVKVYYDTAVLQLVDYAAGDFSAFGYSWSQIEDAAAKGYFVINWADGLGDNNTAELLATLTFEVLEGAKGFISITPEFSCADDIFDANEVSVWFEAVSGGVRIPSTVSGDADGDGEVNNRDLGLLQQHLNGWDVPVHTAVADLNQDGDINNRDLAILQRLINGWYENP